MRRHTTRCHHVTLYEWLRSSRKLVWFGLKHSRNDGNRVTLYYSFVYPYLLYANITWGNSDGVTLWPIFKMQKLAIRLIENLTYRQLTSSSLKKLNLLKLSDLYTLSAAIFMHNFVNNKLPDVFSQFFNMAENIHTHQTRQRAEIRLPLVKSKVANAFICKMGPKIWLDYK